MFIKWVIFSYAQLPENLKGVTVGSFTRYRYLSECDIILKVVFHLNFEILNWNVIKILLKIRVFLFYLGAISIIQHMIFDDYQVQLPHIVADY